MDTLRLAGAPDTGDLAAFLGRAAALDPAVLVRLRALDVGERRYLAAYTRPPLGVLVSRSVRGHLDQGRDDVTVAAADLADALTASTDADGERVVPLPPPRDGQWRGTLPPASGWRRLDTVPLAVLRQLVESGVASFTAGRAEYTDPKAGQSVADQLLDADALTVADSTHQAVLPLRVPHAAWRMGFFGDSDNGGCPVSVAGRWVRLAAPYGSVFKDSAAPGLLS